MIMEKCGYNELLKRIKRLEENNASIRQEINSKRKKLSSITKYVPYESITNDSSLYSYEDDDNKVAMKYYDLMNNEENIKMNVIEYTIEYYPFDNHRALYIMGDFNNWEMELMYKTRGVFKYPTVLLKGFQYYYTLCDENGERISIDINQPSEINPITKTEANYIDLGVKGKKVTQFDDAQLGNILSLQRKNLLMIRAGNWNEVYFIERLSSDIDYYLTQSKAIEYDKIITTEAINQFLNNPMIITQQFKQLNLPNNTSIGSVLCKLLVGRVIIKDNKEYEVISYIDESNAIDCYQLYDNNHLQLNREYYIQNCLINRIDLCDVFNSSHKLLSKEYSKTFLEKYFNNSITNNDILKIYYNPSTTPITPCKLEPKTIDINDYSLEICDNQIIQVKNRKDNTHLKFISLEIAKEEKVNEMEIYFSLYHKNININHIHFINQSLSQKYISAMYIDNKTNIKEIKERSKAEKYTETLLLLCKGMKPFKVYHKGHKVHFISKSYVNERLYQVASLSEKGSQYNHYYAKIKHIPIGLLIRNSPNDKGNYNIEANTQGPKIGDHCKYDNDYSGYIGVAMLFNQSKEVIHVSANDDIDCLFPACLLNPLDPNEEIELDKKYMEYKKKNKPSYEIQKFELLIKELNTYVKYKENNEELLKKLNKSDAKKIIFTLQDYESSAQMIAVYIEENELWDKMDDLFKLQSMINEYLKVLAKYQ